MKNTINLFFLSALILIAGCQKGSVEPRSLFSDLTDGPWRLVSATSTNNNGTVSYYQGLQQDSVLFMSEISSTGGLSPSVIESHIKGTKSTCSYTIHRVPIGQPAAFDTIYCGTVWRQGYSDTIFVKKFDDQQLIFQVRYSFNGGGIELDSLAKIRFGY